MRTLYVNDGESVIEAFWDEKLYDLEEWSKEGSKAIGLSVKKNWCDLFYGWGKGVKDDTCLRLTKNYEDLDCREYDKIILSAAAPVGCRIRLTVTTDTGQASIDSEPYEEIKKELAVDVSNASTIKEIGIHVIGCDEQPGYGYLQWVGMVSEKKLSDHLKHFQDYDSLWEGYLKGESFEPSFNPVYGIIADEQELEELRTTYKNQYGTDSIYEKALASFVDEEPEGMIHDYVNFCTDRRFGRERNYEQRLTQKGPLLATAGIMLKDKRLLRLAARYAMSIASCTYWNDAFITQTIGSDWEHRAFVKATIGYELGIILDLAGEYFTDAGRDLILRRLAEETIGSTNFITWKHDYIYENNQLAWFSHGRMMAYAILEQHYNHIKPYTDIAYKDLVENMNHIIYEDGGYGEGPSYMNCIGDNALFAFYVYGRIRNRDFHDVVPERVKKTGRFIEALSSTTADQDAIPVCDGRPVFQLSTVVNYAYLLPNSYWSAILDKALGRPDSKPTELLTFKLLASMEARRFEAKKFIHLDAMGLVASYRELNGLPLKIMVFGNKANIDHAHEDKGSFVIEYDGQVYAMDPGNFDYASSYSYAVKLAKYHNVTIPYGDYAQEPGPERPNTEDVYVHGDGDDLKFNAQVDLTHTWRSYFDRLTRRIYSESPEMLLFEDDFNLKIGSGVDFGWNTELDVEVCSDGTVVIQGDKANLVITAVSEAVANVTKLPKFDGKTQNRISFRQNGKEGTIRVKAIFVPKG